MGELSMLWYTPLSPEVYEIINCALMTSDAVALIICFRYLVSAYFQFRLALTPLGSLNALRSHKLSIGFTVFLCGEFPRMWYLWLAHYLTNTGTNATWMSEGWWIYFPIVSSIVAVVGMACVVRALVPRTWGRFGYVGTIAAAASMIVVTHLLRDIYLLLDTLYATGAAVTALLLARRLLQHLRGTAPG